MLSRCPLGDEASSNGRLFLLFLLENADAVAANGDGDADHRLEQLDGDLLLRLIDLHDAGLLALERARNELDDVPFHDAADNRLRREVRLDLGEADARRLALAFHDAPRPAQAERDLLPPHR